MDLYGNMENNLKLKSDIILHNLDNLIVEIENNKLTNKQWVLDFLDKLNKISVKY